MFEKFNTELLYKINNFLYALGYFSEFIMIIFVCWIIYNNSINLLFYIIGINISWILNKLLKPLIKDKRPNDPIKFLNSEHFVKTSNAYGMPSGHSQNVFFSVTYLYLTTKQLYWTFIGLIIGILTIFERWYFHNHTIRQLIVGAILGCILAYLMVLVKDKTIFFLKNTK
jgi:membrane-associated phospholipid phosphatase